MPKKLPDVAYNASNKSKPSELFIKRNIYKAYAFYGKDNLEAFEVPPTIKRFLEWRRSSIWPCKFILYSCYLLA